MGKNRGKASNGEQMPPDQFVELSAATLRCLPRVETPEVQKMIGSPRLYKVALSRIFAPPPPTIITGQKALDEWHRGWPKFWRCFGFNLDGRVLETPEYKSGFGWSVATPKDLANIQAYEICQKMGFSCWSWWNDLDQLVSPRSPDKTHLIVCRDRVEADEENKNLSANHIRERKMVTMDARERMVLEARYYAETGQHLDVENLTLSCSRGPVGGFARLRWYPVLGKFRVHYAYPESAYPSLRARSVFVVL